MNDEAKVLGIIWTIFFTFTGGFYIVGSICFAAAVMPQVNIDKTLAGLLAALLISAAMLSALGLGWTKFLMNAREQRNHEVRQ